MRAKSAPSPLLIEVQFGASRRGVPHVLRLRKWALAAYTEHAAIHMSAGLQATGTGRSANRKTSYKTKQKKIPAATLSVRIVTATESRQLNSHWREKDKSTNVLSFPAGDVMTEEGAYNLGDMAICAQVVAREAKEQHKKPDAHWAHMMIHGVLHLLGYDHETSRDAKVMEAIEIRVLQQFGFANPYEC